MTRFYSIDDANAALPDVGRILEDLRDQRDELIRLRDLVTAAQEGEPTSTKDRESPAPDGSGGTTTADTRTLRLRMQFLIDQMQAGVTRLVEQDVTLREIGTGLIDFPALVNGRQVWLCWRLGEGDIGWWHELGDGFADRSRLADLT
ncbi:MAG TPA: DUF2203 domain-containing protein [Candidatus Limnocylindrales bacterium]|nr:DUF2203 domain-containing protein [Candidatus Limnocylindrales bacterium]